MRIRKGRDSVVVNREVVVPDQQEFVSRSSKRKYSEERTEYGLEKAAVVAIVLLLDFRA
jgi:hypothetical protein